MRSWSRWRGVKSIDGPLSDEPLTEVRVHTCGHHLDPVLSVALVGISLLISCNYLARVTKRTTREEDEPGDGEPRFISDGLIGYRCGDLRRLGAVEVEGKAPWGAAGTPRAARAPRRQLSVRRLGFGPTASRSSSEPRSETARPGRAGSELTACTDKAAAVLPR